MKNIDSVISVIISTYNSSVFIIETLDSVKNQSWKNIELIITDDCSHDETVEFCTKWLKENKSRFSSAKILTSEINTGVSGNANRGLQIASGDWIKFLGADDTLKPDCIEDNMSWIASHPESKALFSRIEVYMKTFEPNNLIETIPGIPYDSNGLMAPERSTNSQYKMLLLSDRIHFTPSVFLHRKTMLSFGGFDERFKLLEDYPLWLNLTKRGYKLYFMDKITVNYRRHPKAINNTGIPYLINPNFFRSEEFRKIYIYPNLPVDLRLSNRFSYYISLLFKGKLINKTNKFLLKFFSIYLNPFRYYIFLKKRLNKKIRTNELYM